MAEAGQRGGILARLIFLALLAGGLVLWLQLRKPRELLVRIDLTGAMPGNVVEADIVVRRGSEALTRSDRHFGRTGAPGALEVLVHARPGDAEVETTLVYAGATARKLVQPVTLGDEPALVAVR